VPTPRETPADCEVGYKRPPREHQFPKGRSGNPKGRPKGALNIKTTLTAALQERVPVTENGRRTRKTKLDLWLIGLVNRAIKGDARAGMMVFTLLGRTGVALVEPEIGDAALGPEDDAMFGDYLRQTRGPRGPEEDGHE
jgi:hypothetical protein